MRTPEQVRWDFVQEWLRKADEDLRAAKLLLKQQFSDYEVVAFHAQQCAEKAIKPYLVRFQIEFPKSHEIERALPGGGFLKGDHWYGSTRPTQAHH